MALHHAAGGMAPAQPQPAHHPGHVVVQVAAQQPLLPPPQGALWAKKTRVRTAHG
jgi:hypothetical protein